MRLKMEVEINIAPNYYPPKIYVYSNELTDEISDAIKILKKYSNFSLNGFKENELYLLKLTEIETFYTENKKVYAKQNGVSYEIKERLYELEELLDKKTFVRIFNSEIVNFKKVEKLNFKLTGTIILYFTNGNITYVSRRYIKKIKDYLEI